MHIKPKKRLGQNFLKDKNIQNKIITACGFHHDDIVLEIGSGRGEMTGLIAPLVNHLCAIEIDSCLYNILKDTAPPNVRLENQDILKFNLQDFLAGNKKKIKVFGNIPYYITTPIIEILLAQRQKIDQVFLTVQKEFGQRIISPPGSKDYGSFSCFVQYYSFPEIMFYIKKESFSPSPKVDSCLLKISMRDQPAVKVKDEELFFKVTRAAFNQRRKTLRNSLENIIGKEETKELLIKLKLNPNIRPEEMSLQNFADLVNG